MVRTTRFMVALLVIILLLSALGRADYPVNAQEGESEEPVRQTTLVVSVTEYLWWLIRWSDNLIVCQITIDHEGLPTGDNIFNDCGEDIFELWMATPPCSLSSDNPAVTSCPGFYLHLVSTRPSEKSILVNLPQPRATVNLSGCDPELPTNRCDRIPSLLLTGIEPLPNESITAVHASAYGKLFTCAGAICEVPLQPTPLNGTAIEFWVDSSYGDSSKRFTAHVRVIDSGVSNRPGGAGWYVDVLSSQWVGQPIASCAQTWQAFPPIGGLPLWLSTPDIPELLASDEEYFFLAGKLITQGMVDATGCPDGGLLPNGYANACGLERGRDKVEAWQNQFDARIIEVAKETGVPAQLMKNLFAQESQFWPGISSAEHLGLGHITENGADALLLWNPSFYDQFCPLVLEESSCEAGYLQLEEDQKTILRGALASQAKTDCPECPAGIDLTNANQSIRMFANTLLADCEQVAQIVYNATGEMPGVVSNYEDLWRFTLANYHAGPGCLSYAVFSAADAGDSVDWESITPFFTPVCQGVVDYVSLIAR